MQARWDLMPQAVWRARRRKLMPALEQAEQVSSEQRLAKVQEFASRTYPGIGGLPARRLSKGQRLSRIAAAKAFLRRLGHPYARRLRPGRMAGLAAQLRRQPWVIHVITGKFFRALRLRRTRARGARVISGFQTPRIHYARYLLGGTTRMIRRPIFDKAYRVLAPQRRKRLRKALASLFGS